MPVVDSRLLNGTLEFGADGDSASFSCQATNVVVEQEDGDEEDVVTVLCGETIGGGTTPGPWHITGTAIQDFDAEPGPSITQWSYEHRNTVVPFTFTPNDKPGAPSITGDVQVKFLGLGGDVNTQITRDFDWSIQDEPAFDWSGGTNPSVPITGVTAGTPGAFTPTGATLPANLAALTSDPVVGVGGTSAPTTAWTVGQYVLLADASSAYWDGSAWVAGAAPALEG